MKTLEIINQEIKQVKRDYYDAIENDQTGNKEKGELNRLNQVKLYLEHEPDEVYLTKTVARLENKQKLIIESYVDNPNLSHDDNQYAKKQHYKIHGLSEIKKQLKNLYYILN